MSPKVCRQSYRGVEFSPVVHAEEEAGVDVLDAVGPVVHAPRQLE